MFFKPDLDIDTIHQKGWLSEIFAELLPEFIERAGKGSRPAEYRQNLRLPPALALAIHMDFYDPYYPPQSVEDMIAEFKLGQSYANANIPHESAQHARLLQPLIYGHLRAKGYIPE